MRKSKKMPKLRDETICLGVDTEATREFLDRVADKWSMLIILVISKSPNQKARFSELRKNLYGISQTMLTQTLRSLERDGLVVRHIYPEIPPKVEYELTDLGVDIMTPMNQLVSWVSKNWNRVRQAQERHDKVANQR